MNERLTVEPPVDVDALPEVGVRNSQPEGIGRVAALGRLVAWNNLGRNVVFADRQFRPVAVFGTTVYPDDDELSQYDLDIHAVLPLGEADLVVTLNHLGSVHGFAAADLAGARTDQQLVPVLSTSWAADLERTAVVGTRLVSSRPGSDLTGGVLVSEPIRPGCGRDRLDADTALDGWGRVTALCSFELEGHLVMAVGGDGHVTIVSTDDGRLGRPRRSVEVPLRAAAVAWSRDLLWVAGSELTSTPVDDYGWEELRGGSYVALDPLSGRIVFSGPLPDDVAWGNGGDAVVMAERHIVAIGRTGSLHVLTDPRSATFASSAPLAKASLGIGHATAVGDRVLFGFNRGGYRLHAGRLPPAPRRA